MSLGFLSQHSTLLPFRIAFFTLFYSGPVLYVCLSVCHTLTLSLAADISGSLSVSFPMRKEICLVKTQIGWTFNKTCFSCGCLTLTDPRIFLSASSHPTYRHEYCWPPVTRVDMYRPITTRGTEIAWIPCTVENKVSLICVSPWVTVHAAKASRPPQWPISDANYTSLGMSNKISTLNSKCWPYSELVSSTSESCLAKSSCQGNHKHLKMRRLQYSQKATGNRGSGEQTLSPLSLGGQWAPHLLVWIMNVPQRPMYYWGLGPSHDYKRVEH